MIVPSSKDAPTNRYFSIEPEEIADIFTMLDKPSVAQTELLMSLAVDPCALSIDWLGNEATIRSAKVEFLPGNRFEFEADAHGDTLPALIIDAKDEFGEHCDLVAIRSDGTWALWLGRVALLGLEQVNAPRATEHLIVHASLFDCLNALRKGIFIFDPDKASIALECAGPLRSCDVEHGRKLFKDLTRQPSIVVPKPQGWRSSHG
jgi:hypothetical protein